MATTGRRRLSHHGHPAWVDPWTAIEHTRGDRPGPLAVLDLLADRTELHGTGAGESGRGVRVSLGRLRGQAAGRGRQDPGDRHPGRSAVAAARVAAGRPCGPAGGDPHRHTRGELSVEAENAAMAGEIARTLLALTALKVHSVSCIMGQGCGGAAWP